MAFVLLAETSPLLAVTQAFAVAFLLPMALLLAPQPIRRDKRTLVILVLAVAFVIAAPVYAAVCNICEICDRCAWWWCPIECWFL